MSESPIRHQLFTPGTRALIDDPRPTIKGQPPYPALALEGCRRLVDRCARVRNDDVVLIVSDDETRPLGEVLSDAAQTFTSSVRHCVIKPFSAHGQEPPADVTEYMRQATVVFGITRMSMAHTTARHQATVGGARYLSLPDYSLDLLAGDALQADFDDIAGEADWLADLFTNGRQLHVTTSLGTDLVCNITGRQGNSAPGICRRHDDLASPPDAEANVPPLENESNGIIVVDGSIPCPEIGLLNSPVTLVVERGRVTDVRGQQAEIVNDLFVRQGNPAVRVIAEFGVGLNPLAQLRGSMLEDEGCRGTCHFGIGSNITIGGENAVPFHLDFVVRAASLKIDGAAVISDGHFLTPAEKQQEKQL